MKRNPGIDPRISLALHPGYMFFLRAQSLAIYSTFWFRAPTCPIERIRPHANISVKRRMWPIANSCYPCVLDRIEMDVVHVPLHVRIVSYGVFPEAPLPQIVLILGIAMNINS